MLVWTQSIPGIKERPVQDLWHTLFQSDRRVKLVLFLLPIVFIVCSTLFKREFFYPVSITTVFFFLVLNLSSKSFNVSIKDFTFDLEPAAFLASLLVVGPAWAVVYSFIGIIFYEYFITKTLLNWKKCWMNAFNIETSILASGAGAILYGLLSPLKSQHEPAFVLSFVLLCLAGFTLIFANELLVSIYFSVLDKVSLLQVLKRSELFYGDMMFATLANLMFVTLTPIGFLFGIVYLFSPFFVITLVPVIAALYYLPKLLFEMKQQTGLALETVAEILNERSGDIERAARMAACTRIIAQEMDLKPEEVDSCAQAARICHIGNIAVRDDVLRKKGGLSKDEYRHVQQHVQVIPELFPNMEEFAKMVRVAMMHHEWYDGTGYPFGLKGQEIPLEARVVAVAEAWDAMTVPRGYKEALSRGEALQILLDGAGIQWDPRVVQAFMKGYEKGLFGRGDKEALKISAG